MKDQYTCRKCSLLFLPEELPDRFNSRTNYCIRCQTNLLLAKNNTEPPSCYGALYDGISLACTTLCSLKEACIIETTDTQSKQWALDVDKRYAKYGMMPILRHVVHLLRALGRPIHLYDMAPLLEKTTKGRFKMDPRMLWVNTIKKNMIRCPDIVDLGLNFFIWKGCWDPEQGGTPGYRSRYRKRQQPVEKNTDT
jgi:hypothetical protein